MKDYAMMVVMWTGISSALSAYTLARLSVTKDPLAGLIVAILIIRLGMDFLLCLLGVEVLMR